MKYKGFNSESDYWKVLEHAVKKALVGIVIANKEGKYIYTNEIYENLTGINFETLGTLSASDVVKLTKEQKSSSLAVFDEKKEIIMQQHILTTGRDVLIKANPVFGDDGEVEYAVSNLMDITKLQMLKNALMQVYKEQGYHEREESENASMLDMWKEERMIVYRSKSMEYVMRLLESIAKSDATALISGESGTGKELFARRIHTLSERKDKPFFAINCSAIPESLLESELFGYESGTFTGGSVKGKAGLLENAEGGTVFLDEIGDMPMVLQSKLLRVLEEREITRLGGYEPIKINARFIAATNLDLSQMVSEKKFREDLYYRLNVLPLHIPALRERREDIPVLAAHYLSILNKKYKKQKTITPEAMNILIRKPFNGNVRQLINLLERAVLMSVSDILSEEIINRLYELDENIVHMPDYAEGYAGITFTGGRSYRELSEEFEEKMLRRYMEMYGSTYKMAAALDVNQSTVFRKMKKYGID